MNIRSKVLVSSSYLQCWRKVITVRLMICVLTISMIVQKLVRNQKEKFLTHLLIVRLLPVVVVQII
ncbi:hypothetical protein F4805DRAFT_442080 [Annulohypoxylon moriforme]|nr:hypothetical protein F4805DRAFT_442080 [Annulohypoxylon moriforme]